MEETERPAAGARPSGGGMGGESAPAWLGVSDVQRYLGISRPLVYRLIREGTIPSILYSSIKKSTFRSAGFRHFAGKRRRTSHPSLPISRASAPRPSSCSGR